MTTIAELITGLEARGVTLSEKQGGIAVRPASALTPTEREVLIAMKGDVLALLRERQSRPGFGVNWSKVSLYELDKVLEVAVPWSDTPLVITPGCRIAQELRTRDPKPGRVWCVCEVLDLLLSGVKPDDARKIAETKVMFDGTVTGVRSLKERQS